MQVLTSRVGINSSNQTSQNVDAESSSTEGGSGGDSLLSRLCFIPLNLIARQEGVEKLRSERIAQEIKQDGILRHPVYVTQLDSEQFTSFDGHNRIHAFNRLGYSSILGQLITFEDILPGTWVQVADASLSQFLEALKQQGFIVDQIPLNQATVNNPSLVATVFSENFCFTIHNHRPLEIIRDTSRVTQTLAKITCRRIERFTDAEISSVLKRLDDRIAVRFPTFTPQQIVEAVRRGEQVGAGVTRWEFRDRIININMPLGAWLNKPVEELNTKLRAAIAAGTTRPYCSHISEAEVKWDDCLR